MRRPDDVRELEQSFARGQRLRVEDVETCAGDASLAQRLDERVLIDDRAARDVDEEGGRLHQPQPARVEQAARLVGQRAGDDDDVGVREQRLEGNVPHPVLGHRRPLRDENVHLPRRQQAHDLASDPAVADHAERPAREAHALRHEAARTPIALVERPVALAEAVAAGEHQSHDRGGHRPGRALRGDRDADPAARARLEVDEVEADPVARE